MNSPPIFIFLPLLILYFTSCNYKSGLTKKSENYNIRLDVINNSKAIQLSPVLNRILKDEIAMYPEIKLADSKVEKSDYSVELRLDSYRLSPESYLAEDTLVANSLKASFNVRMKKHFRSKSIGAIRTLRKESSTMNSYEWQDSCATVELAHVVALTYGCCCCCGCFLWVST